MTHEVPPRCADELLKIDMTSPAIAFGYHSWGLAVYIENLEDLIGHYGDQYRLLARRKLDSRKDVLEDFEYVQEANYIDEVAEHHIPGYARMSAIVLLWGMFESTVIDVARYVKKREKANLGLKDIRGNNFLDGARKYYAAVLDIELPWTETDIHDAQALSAIRNKIAHRNGWFMDAPEEEKNTFVKKIRNIPSVEVQGSQLLVAAEYVDSAAKLVFSMLESLHEMICNRYNDVIPFVSIK